MNRRSIMVSCAALLAVLLGAPALPHDPPTDGCGTFSRDVVNELAVMRSAAIPITAETGSESFPRLALDKHYAISLIAQDQFRFVAKPGRPSRSSEPRGGAFRFEVPATGRYRVSITSRHWIDVISRESAIDSVDHHGPGCDLVHKVVEFDLNAGQMFTLQLSGQDDAIIGLAITASPINFRQGNK